MEKTTIPSAAVDGIRVRTIRESKKLTQLYVANMVGVTTDTISRWENNRYPTIRKDNAEKLAEALEVSLVEILRKEEVPPAPEPVALPVAEVRKNGTGWILIIGIVMLLATGLVVRFLLPHEPPVIAVRMLPKFAAPGEIVPVRIVAGEKGKPRPGIIIREALPPGWVVVKTHPAATGERDVKWLVPEGTGKTTLYYTVRVPALAAGQATFSGKGAVQEQADQLVPGSIGGNASIAIGGSHWADTNGDGRIDDNEIMPAYYLTEEMKNMGLDWKMIEAIWSGGGYRWDPSTKNFNVLPKPPER